MHFAILIIALLLDLMMGAATAQAQSVTLAPTSGHPNLSVTLSGTSFATGEAVDIYIDTVDTLLVGSSSTGTVTASVSIPASATPGTHYISAIGRRSGDFAQAIFTVSTGWFEFGFGAAHHGFNPYENTLSASNVSTLGTLWSVTAAGSGGSGGTPAISGGQVFVTSQPSIQARSTTTGAILWNRIGAENFSASPALAGGTVYAGSVSGNFYAFNSSTGATIWGKALSSMYSSPVVSGGIVYVGCYGDHKVYALNATTSATLWTYSTGGAIEGSPAIANGILYIGSTDGKLYALNAATGALVWSYATRSLVEGSPAVANGVVYFGSDDKNVYAVNAATGNLLWSYTTGGFVFDAPAVAYGTVYIGSTDGNMYALDASAGTLQWSTATGGVVRTAVIANGVVYATSNDGFFYAFAAGSGSILARGLSGNTLNGSPAVSDGVLYVNAYGGALTAYALLAGNDPKRAPAQATPAAPAISSLHPNYSLPLTH